MFLLRDKDFNINCSLGMRCHLSHMMSIWSFIVTTKLKTGHANLKKALCVCLCAGDDCLPVGGASVCWGCVCVSLNVCTGLQLTSRVFLHPFPYYPADRQGLLID